MGYNESLCLRIRELLAGEPGLVEKKMFGGIAYMLKDKMMCGIVKDDLMVRCLEDKYEQLLKKPHVRVMDFTGRTMKGFLYVDSAGIKTDKQLMDWLDIGIEFAHKSPPKKKKKAKK